jgi:hypothetical protein
MPENFKKNEINNFLELIKLICFFLIKIEFKSSEYFNQKADNNMYGSNANVMIPHTSKCWTPIDNYNENYIRQQDNFSSKDFLKLNVENIHDQSEFNKYVFLFYFNLCILKSIYSHN